MNPLLGSLVSTTPQQSHSGEIYVRINTTVISLLYLEVRFLYLDNYYTAVYTRG